MLFHEAIVEAAGNAVLSGIMRNLTPLLLKSLKTTAQTTLDIPKVIRQHRAIFETIRHGQSGARRNRDERAPSNDRTDCPLGPEKIVDFKDRRTRPDVSGGRLSMESQSCICI